MAFAGIILTYQDKVLIFQRSKHMEHFPGFWSIPSGHIEKGESPGEAAIRETYEETAIKISVEEDIKFIKKLSTKNGPFYIFHHKLVTWPRPILNEEHTGYGLVTEDSVHRMKPIQRQLVELIYNILIKEEDENETND